MKINSINSFENTGNLIILSDRDNLIWADKMLPITDAQLLQHLAQQDAPFAQFNNNGRWIFVDFSSNKDSLAARQEALRRQGGSRISQLRQLKIEDATLINKATENNALAYLEGLFLGNYQFLKYFKDADKRRSSFQELNVPVEVISPTELEECLNVLEAVSLMRDLINEPHSFLNAVQLAKEIEQHAAKVGIRTEHFDKAKIESMGMGGLLAVNKGSLTPPTFNIMEWKPEDAKNAQPIVLVGKGVVYDTGGLSLKPTANSMDFMKADMGGAALVIASIYAAAKNKLPLHIIGLVPATDNRPGVDAYAPGDVIKMYSGSHVEVLNTDAEGRMILADALHFAKQYDPAFVLDFATLTGSAARAIGSQAAVMMGNIQEKVKEAIKVSAEKTYERVVEFPIWEEYADELKSDIADLKNLGGPTAGAITAGKFLEHFTDYPWLHFDIAGVAFLHKESTYKTRGGSGFGVRMIYDFLKNG
jgi:leucyl aminopeptidase